MASRKLITKLEEARTAFIAAERASDNSRYPQEQFPTPQQRHFESLGIAIYVLDSYTKIELEGFERDSLVHGSTISGGSLYVARETYHEFIGLGGKLNPKRIGRDGYEQLNRICGSARDILVRRGGLGMRRVENGS